MVKHNYSRITTTAARRKDCDIQQNASTGSCPVLALKNGCTRPRKFVPESREQTMEIPISCLAEKRGSPIEGRIGRQKEMTPVKAQFDCRISTMLTSLTYRHGAGLIVGLISIVVVAAAASGDGVAADADQESLGAAFVDAAQLTIIDMATAQQQHAAYDWSPEAPGGIDSVSQSFDGTQVARADEVSGGGNGSVVADTIVTTTRVAPSAYRISLRCLDMVAGMPGKQRESVGGAVLVQSDCLFRHVAQRTILSVNGPFRIVHHLGHLLSLITDARWGSIPAPGHY